MDRRVKQRCCPLRKVFAVSLTRKANALQLPPRLYQLVPE